MLDLITRTKLPYTQETLVHQLRELGIQCGDILLVHSILSRLGWVCGAEQTVVSALMELWGHPELWLCRPTHPIIQTLQTGAIRRCPNRGGLLFAVRCQRLIQR